MKYTLCGFSQEKAIEFKLDIKDLNILRYIIDFYHTGKMTKKTINGKEYFWIKYQNIIEQLPLLELKTKDSIYRRLSKLVNAGILDHVTLKIKGTFSFYRFTEKIDCLIYSDYSDEIKYPIGSNQGTPTDEIKEQNINLLKDSSTKYNKGLFDDLQDNKNKKTLFELQANKLYSMYPSRCPETGDNLKKSSKDKETIIKYLKNKTYSFYQIFKQIEDLNIEYMMEKENPKDFRPRMKNFNNFLKSFPAKEDLEIPWDIPKFQYRVLTELGEYEDIIPDEDN